MKYRTKSYFCPKCLKTITVYAPTIAYLRTEYEQAINKHRQECWLTPRAADLPPAASLVESNAKAANR
jgi:hypothetical protein